MSSELASMAAFMRRNVWLALATALAIVALGAALIAIGGLGRVEDRREADRVAADVSSCQRGNDNRRFQAEQIRRVVERIAMFTGVEEADRALLLAAIEPELEPRVTQCAEVVIGADPTVPNFPQEEP